MENKTIENIAICAAVIGSFILIAYIIKKFDKIVLKWKDISATFGMNSTTESATEPSNKSSKEDTEKGTTEVSKKARNESPSKVENSENIELISKDKKTIKKSDPQPESPTKGTEDSKPKFEVEPASPSNIKNFANIKQDHKGIQQKNETKYADVISVTKDAKVDNVANIDVSSNGGENNTTTFERKINFT